MTSRLATVLHTYEKIANERGNSAISQHYYPIAGQTLYMLILYGMLFAYLYIFRRDYFEDDRTVVFIITLIGLFTLLRLQCRPDFQQDSTSLRLP